MSMKTRQGVGVAFLAGALSFLIGMGCWAFYTVLVIFAEWVTR